MQAAEEASTSGREYWQVMLPSLLCRMTDLPSRPLDGVLVALSECPAPDTRKLGIYIDYSHIMGSAI